MCAVNVAAGRACDRALIRDSIRSGGGKSATIVRIVIVRRDARLASESGKRKGGARYSAVRAMTVTALAFLIRLDFQVAASLQGRSSPRDPPRSFCTFKHSFAPRPRAPALSALPGLSRIDWTKAPAAWGTK